MRSPVLNMQIFFCFNLNRFYSILFRCLTEDSILLQSLGRDTGATIATVDAVYKSDLDVKAEIQGRYTHIVC